jgi:hypothetical protein
MFKAIANSLCRVRILPGITAGNATTNTQTKSRQLFLYQCGKLLHQEIKDTGSARCSNFEAKNSLKYLYNPSIDTKIVSPHKTDIISRT